jgi:hypothetical protein
MTAIKQTSTQITHGLLLKQGKELTQLSANISIALNDISDIKHHLHSDKNTNSVGTVERSINNEGRIIHLEQREKIYVAKFSMIYAIGTAFGGLVVWFFTRVFLKSA